MGKIGQYQDMMTSSNGNIFRVTGHLCGEFTGPRWIPHTKASGAGFDVFFDLGLNKRLSKQWWGWWFETLSRLLWRHRNETTKSEPCEYFWDICCTWCTGIILGTGSANERRRYIVTPPLIGCAHTQNNHWCITYSACLIHTYLYRRDKARR